MTIYNITTKEELNKVLKEKNTENTYMTANYKENEDGTITIISTTAGIKIPYDYRYHRYI